MRADSVPAPGPSHRALWLAVSLACLALHLSALTQYGWFRDEFYYMACAARLDWGYVDHPPLSIAVLTVLRTFFGDSLIAIRLAAALLGAAAVYLTARLAGELGGGRFAQLLAGLAALVAPVFLGVSRFYSMNVLDLLLWTMAALALVSALRTARTSDWIWLGIVVGLGLLNKLSMLWFGAGLFAGLLLTPHRRQLATPGPWVALAVTAALFAPHVAWQMAHGWPTLEFMRNATGHKMAPVSIIGFLLGQFQVMGPGNLLVYLPGLAFALFSRAGRPWRLLGILFVAVAAVLIFAGTSRPSYLAVAYPMLFALGGVAWEHWSRRRPATIRTSLVAAVTLFSLPLAPIAIPMLPVESFIRYQTAIGLSPSTEERKDVGPLPQGYADMFGWPDLVTAVAKASDRLTIEERRKAVVFGQNYGEAGAIDVLGRRLGLPRAISGHNNYWLWGPGDWDGRVMIIIGGDADDNASFFESVERVGVWDHPLAMPYERGLDISIARGFKGSPREAWPQLKNYN